MLRPGFTLPPLMFSADELEALVLGSRWVADARKMNAWLQRRTNSIAKYPRRAPSRTARRASYAATLTVPNVSSAESAKIDVSVLGEIALRKGAQGHHLPYSDTDGARTSAIVWPFALGFSDRVQVVVAWCELRRTCGISASTESWRLGYRRFLFATRPTLLKEWRENQRIADS